MTAELAPLALCSGGANISAEVLQLNHADLGLLTLPEQIRNHSGLCPLVCSFFCSCLVSALLFLCFGFLKCALWELRPALRQTPVKGCVQPQLPAGLLAQLQPASHNPAFLSAGTPHTCSRSWLGMLTAAPERFCSQVRIARSPTECQCPWDSSGAWVGEAGSMLLSADASKASWCVTNQMAVV